MTIKTRFAPSPTGLLHIGGVYAPLYFPGYMPDIIKDNLS